MVISGLPNRNGIQHAAHIANMSCDIANAVSVFEVSCQSPQCLMPVKTPNNSNLVVNRWCLGEARAHPTQGLKRN